MSTKTTEHVSEERIEEVAREAMEELKKRFDPTNALNGYTTAQNKYDAKVRYNKHTMPHTLFLAVPNYQRKGIKVIMPVLKNIGVATMNSMTDGGTTMTFNTDHFDSLFDIQANILQMSGKSDDQEDTIQIVLPGGTFKRNPNSVLQMEATMYWLHIPVSLYLDVCVKLIKRYQEGLKTSHIALHVIDPEDSAYKAGELYESEPTDFHEGPQRRPYQMVMSVKRFCQYQKNLDFAAPSAPASSPSKKTPKRTREADESESTAKSIKTE